MRQLSPVNQGSGGSGRGKTNEYKTEENERKHSVKNTENVHNDKTRKIKTNKR